MPRAPEVAVRQHLLAGSLAADLEVAPGSAGNNAIRASFRSSNGDRPTPREVWAELSLAPAGIGPIRRQLAWNSSEGTWDIEGSELSVSGRWSLRLQVPVSDFEAISFETEVQIR
jgi:hypothetical protein